MINARLVIHIFSTYNFFLDRVFQTTLFSNVKSFFDCFVIVGSDGLFDFFSNEEAVKLVHSYILGNPSGDPAKFLLEQLVERAADCAGKPLIYLHAKT